MPGPHHQFAELAVTEVSESDDLLSHRINDSDSREMSCIERLMSESPMMGGRNIPRKSKATARAGNFLRRREVWFWVEEEVTVGQKIVSRIDTHNLFPSYSGRPSPRRANSLDILARCASPCPPPSRPRRTCPLPRRSYLLMCMAMCSSPSCLLSPRLSGLGPFLLACDCMR